MAWRSPGQTIGEQCEVRREVLAIDAPQACGEVGPRRLARKVGTEVAAFHRAKELLEEGSFPRRDGGDVPDEFDYAHEATLAQPGRQNQASLVLGHALSCALL